MLVVMRDGAPAFVELSADLDDADPVSPSVLVSPVAARATLGGTATPRKTTNDTAKKPKGGKSARAIEGMR